MPLVYRYVCVTQVSQVKDLSVWLTNSLTPTQYSMSESSQQSHARYGKIRYVPYVIKESSYFCINHHFNYTLSIVTLPGVLTWLKTLIYWKNHHRATKVVSDISSLPCIDCLRCFSLYLLYCQSKEEAY